MLCFRKIGVAKKFMDESSGEYQDFPPKKFCLSVPKNFLGESFKVSLIPMSKKVRDKKRGEGFAIFCRFCFCLTVRK